MSGTQIDFCQGYKLLTFKRFLDSGDSLVMGFFFVIQVGLDLMTFDRKIFDISLKRVIGRRANLFYADWEPKTFCFSY